MKKERFSVKEFNKQFPDDSACLDYIFAQRFPNGAACKCGHTKCFYRVEKRKCYSCSHCGHQISPTEGTIFHKSSTKLKTWFYAMFLMTASKNGVSAKELERLTGVTYKTAWRMGHQIRKLMTQGEGRLSGVVEGDESWLGGRRRTSSKFENKAPVIGLVERNGDVRAKVAFSVNSWNLKQVLDKNLSRDAHLVTDELRAYLPAVEGIKQHSTVNHSKGEYVRAEIHTNSIEGFWSQLKRSVNGTFHQVSRPAIAYMT